MEDFNGDGFTAYPTDALGNTYYLVTADNYAAFLITATGNGTTTVDITVEGKFILYNRVYRKGEVLSVTLQQYQVESVVCKHLMSTHILDLSMGHHILTKSVLTWYLSTNVNLWS